MNKNKAKQAGLKRRQRRVRGKIFGTPSVRVCASFAPMRTSTP